jgi:TolB-like protein/tetratricopeptide (TPR) repeat protein
LPLPGNFSEKIRASSRVAYDDTVLEFGGFRLNRGERSLLASNGAPIQLTRRLYDVLLYMAERPGRLLEKQALMDSVWKGAVVEENTLSRTISNLRQLLGEGTGEHRYIETVSGLGYRFVAPVKTVQPRSAAEAAARDRVPSIAVLAFTDLSQARDQGHFAEGIAEEVLNRLATVPGLRVTAKSSAFRFRDTDESARAIGAALGVDYLLSGAVRKEGRALRITAQLVDTAGETQRWSERFDRGADLENVFAIQDDIARAVTHALRGVLGAGEPSPLQGGTRDAEAYDLFLRGRALIGQGGAHATLRSAELFRAAVTRDPKFAAAWMLLARASRSQLVFAPQRSAQAVADLLEASTRVLELDPLWWATHIVQGWRHHVRRDWLAMQQSLEKARDLAPETSGEIEFNVGVLHTQFGESDAAIEHFRAAARMDPLSLLLCGLLQKELMIAGRYDEADAEYRRSRDLVGDREMVEHLVLHARWARGEPFREQFRRYLDLTETKPAPVLHEVYAVCEEPARVLEKLRAAAVAPDYQLAPFQIVLAWWLAAYGDVEGAFASMWRGFVDLGYANVSWLWFPVLARAREHARFPELLERVGLTAYWRARDDGRPKIS